MHFHFLKHESGVIRTWIDKDPMFFWYLNIYIQVSLKLQACSAQCRPGFQIWSVLGRGMLMTNSSHFCTFRKIATWASCISEKNIRFTGICCCFPRFISFAQKIVKVIVCISTHSIFRRIILQTQVLFWLQSIEVNKGVTFRILSIQPSTRRAKGEVRERTGKGWWFSRLFH